MLIISPSRQNLEKELNKITRASAKADRRDWLEQQLGDGNWTAIKAHRKGFKPTLGRLQNQAGELVESSMRADTMATHFETVQWAGHPEPLEDLNLPTRAFEQNLIIDIAPFSRKELIYAIQQAKQKKASGAEDIPAEFWKALSQDDDAMAQLLHLCNTAWDLKQISQEWKHANVVTFFKKGHTALPISRGAIERMPKDCCKLHSTRPGRNPGGQFQK